MNTTPVLDVLWGLLVLIVGMGITLWVCHYEQENESLEDRQGEPLPWSKLDNDWQ